jgi:hypothetical protein
MSPHTARATRIASPPRSVQAARALLAVVAAGHLVIPVVMWLRQDSLRDEIARQQPQLGAAALDDSVRVALASATAFHAALLGLSAFLIWKLATGRPWTRRLTTISQALAVIFSVVSWSTSTMFHAVIPVLDILQVVIIVLVWTPSARGFFARRAD